MKKANDPSLGRIKSTGTDDGFQGEGAACGHSVVAVAHQMINGKLTDNGKSYSDDENTIVSNYSVVKKVTRQRRNSKSLPASPRTSPKMLRRNPYFTNILLGMLCFYSFRYLKIFPMTSFYVFPRTDPF